MPTGVHTCTHCRIDYKTLRAVNPEAARVAETARTFGITRASVYAFERKRLGGSLADRSRAPHHRPRHTPPAVKKRVVAVRNQTHLGPKRLSLYLAKYEGLKIPWATIRHILRHHHHQLTPPFGKRCPSAARPFVDWYAAKPFEIVPMDLKYIRDHKALSQDQIAHLDRYGVPNFQWGALDDLLSLQADGLLPGASASGGDQRPLLLSLDYRLVAPQGGVTGKIVFTVDHGEEFGSQPWFKVQTLWKLIAGLGCSLIQTCSELAEPNHKGHPEENASA